MDLDQALRSFKRAAFRLELHPRYNVPEEVESYRRYLAGEIFPPQADPAWTAHLATVRESGRSVTRLRVIPSPMTSYFRFEVECGYKWNAAAGEEIYFLPPNTIDHASDCWLFDEDHGFSLKYDMEGKYLGAVTIDPMLLFPLLEKTNSWMKRAISFQALLAQMRRGEL